MKLRAIVAACTLGVLLCLEGGCSRPADGTATSQRPPAAIETITVAPRAIARAHESVGELRSPQSTTITAEIAGKIVALDVPEGREVEAGHLLVRIDDAQARAAVAVNRARSRNAREILERLEALRGDEIASQQELDNAQAQREATAGELDTAETLLAKTEIRAPFRGVLGLRAASLGDYLEPGDPIVQLTQTRPLDLVFGLPERYVSQVALEQRVTGLVPTCETFEARVTAIDPRIDPETRVVRIKAEVANEDGALLAGMSAAVRLTIGEEPQALTVPQAALLRRGTERMVYVVREDDTVEERPVTIGTLHEDWAEVRSGLAAGEVVVVTGHQKLAPGARVAARPYTPIENPNLALGEDGIAFGCTL